MSTSFLPYLFFPGDCRAAFTRYHEIFGGDLQIMANADGPEGGMPGAGPDAVLHAAITMPDGAMLMGSDDPGGDSGPRLGISVSVSVDGVDEARRVYDALVADGGTVDMPLEPSFFSPAFGGVTDRFGVAWLVGANAEA
jgi:PhnB protein